MIIPLTNFKRAIALLDIKGDRACENEERSHFWGLRAIALLEIKGDRSYRSPRIALSLYRSSLRKTRQYDSSLSNDFVENCFL